jgi:hypothetical protein
MTSSNVRPGIGSISADNIVYALVTFIFALVAHAVAYLTHEYSHSLMAWSLGWMREPFGIDYGPATLSNVVFLGDVSDNVNYGPILASGHGGSAALIALAGPFIGNGLLYVILYGLASTSVIKSSRFLLSFFYWLSLMCAANVWGYVPIRAITTHADIAIAAQGLGISTWVLFPFLMIVSGYITYHFFNKTFPRASNVITGEVEGNQVFLIAFTSFWYFSFFGADGISGSYGLISQILSIASRYLLFPLCVVYLSLRYGDKSGAPRVGIVLDSKVLKSEHGA